MPGRSTSLNLDFPRKSSRTAAGTATANSFPWTKPDLCESNHNLKGRPNENANCSAILRRFVLPGLSLGGCRNRGGQPRRPEFSASPEPAIAAGTRHAEAPPVRSPGDGLEGCAEERDGRRPLTP